MKIFCKKEKLKFLFLILCFFSFVVFTEFSEVYAGSLDTDVVIFPDKNLEVSIREKLAKPTGDITVGDMKGVSGYLSLSDKGITNIVGLEHLSSVSGLVLSTGKAVKSGSTSTYIRIKGAGDTNAYARAVATVPITISDKIGSNDDITVDFSIDNSLEAVLGSNTINFGEVSSVGGEIQNTTLTVSSSLVYNISTMAYGDFVGSIDGTNIIPIDKISLDIDGLGYKALSKNKTINVWDSPSAINKVHNLNFKMGDTLGYKKDNYNAVVQFIVDVK